MTEYDRIMENAAVMPEYHGTTTVDVVEKILDRCNGQFFCNGQLREFVFTPITKSRYKFHTEDWYAKTYSKN